MSSEVEHSKWITRLPSTEINMESDGANFHGWDIVESYPSNNGTQ